MSTAVVPVYAPAVERPLRFPPIPWRNPHSVAPAELAGHIDALERACREHPQSADLRTCLGMAYAMNHQVYPSMDALEAARLLDDTHFFAQFKYAELLYRLRALPSAEMETAKAIDLAGNPWELSMARQQLREIRARIREGTQKPEWDKPLAAPALVLLGLLAVLSSIMVMLR